jgi:membrane protein YdbS with pleckstrin-like domain
MTDTRSPKTPLLTAWDLVSAVAVGIVCFVMSLVHQEELWVAVVSGAVTAVVMLVIYPVIRHLMNRR